MRKQYYGAKQEEDCTQAHGAPGSCHCGGSCNLRCTSHQRPDDNNISFGEDEEDLIIKMHALLGNRWSLIAGRLPGRTENEVKDYWNSYLKQKLIKMGIDPENHRASTHSQLRCCMTCAASSSTLPLKPKDDIHGEGYDNVASSSSEEDAHSLPGLNLDLTTTSYSVTSRVGES